MQGIKSRTSLHSVDANAGAARWRMPASGQSLRKWVIQAMSALHLIATELLTPLEVGFVPIPDLGALTTESEYLGDGLKPVVAENENLIS